MAIKGFASQSRKSRELFATLQELGGGRIGLDIVQNGFYKVLGLNLTVAAITGNVLTINNHTAKDSDQIKINGVTYAVIEIINANTLKISEYPQDVNVGDSVDIMRPVVIRVDESGSQITSQGPVQFIKDGATVEVTQDTNDSNNNVAFPVELVGASGDINITAGDINVQLQHDGANPDSVQIGDGTNKLGINANNEAKTHDADLLAKLEEVRAIVDGNSTEAKQDSTIAKIGEVLSKNDEILTELKVKADPNENQNVVVTSSVLPSGASTETKQTDTINKLDEILTDLQGKVDKNETQPVSVASLPLPAGAATETKQDDNITKLDNILTELQGKADLSETQPVSVQSSALPSGASTEAKQDSIISKLDSLVSDSQMQVVGSKYIVTENTNIPASSAGFLEIENSVASNIRKIQSMDTTGAFIGVYVGASGSETLKYIIGPGSDTTINCNINSGTRISLRNMDDYTISSGSLGLNYIG